MYRPGDPNELSKLAKKYVEGKASPEEIHFLEQYYASFDQLTISFNETSDVQTRAAGRDMKAFLTARLEETELSKAVTTGTAPAEMPVIRRMPTRRLRWIAAAVLIGLLVTGVYIWKANKAPSDLAFGAIEKKLAPGGHKALLTLGNGKTIVLDTLANGVLAQQGGMQVVKLANGQLAYQGILDDGTNSDGESKPGGGAGAGGLARLSYDKIETPAGGEYQVILPDGTRVWLNAASSLRYPSVFAGKERKVEVTGEAYFDVARDKKRPFIVSSNGMQVEVLGTEFNIMAYPDEEAIRTTLVNGAVRVIKDGNAQLIRPGQQAALPAGAGQFTLSTPDLNEVLGWKEGEFRFYNAKLTTILRQVARWYDVEVVYEGAIPQDEFYGVIPKKAYAAQILNVLEKSDYVHFRIEGRKIIVLAGPKK